MSSRKRRTSAKKHAPRDQRRIENASPVEQEYELAIDSLSTLERVASESSLSRFSRIDLGDLLERIAQPEESLRRVHALLAPGGKVSARFANVRQERIVRGLVRGNWLAAAEPVQPFDRIRFFTRREIEKCFYRCGFAVSEIVPQSGLGSEGAESAPSDAVRLGKLEFRVGSHEAAAEFQADAYHVTAVRDEPADYGLTSIVILTFNQWDYTRRCLESIRFRTDEPYELIVVDNASTDGTPERLAAMRDVTLIANHKNRGFPAGANQGMRVARGRQVLLLNNDVVVTTGWLRRQLEALHRDARIGLVGPCSNEVSGPQQVRAEYADLTALDGFAWQWAQRHSRQMQDVDRLVGFCLLIRREAMDEIGLLDERFGIGNFEDDDYTRRALLAGYRAVIARDAFIHHFGHRTFSASGVDLNSLLRENARQFEQKWSDDNAPTSAEAMRREDLPAAGEEREPSPAPSACHKVFQPTGQVAPNEPPLALSLCMIVRDNEKTIRPCLESIKPWVDEMIVVDTGSRDATPEIAASLGARIFRFPWCDSFSAARNESLRYARGAWIFWMDSDDVISEECGRELRRLALADAPASRLGYIMQVHCPGGGPEGEHDVTVVDHVKLFRNLPELRFEGRIHEQLLGSIRRLAGEVEFTSVHVIHAGADHTPEGRLRKLKRDFKLLKLELAEQPEHPFTLFNLGMTYADAGKYRRAVTMLRQSIAHSHPGDSQVRKAYALLVSSLSQLNRHDEAQETCQEGLRLYPQDAELGFRQALLAHRAGQLKEAERAYLRVLTNQEGRHFSSIDRGIVGFKARQNLAVVYADMGDLVRAEEQWRAVVDEAPAYRDGWLGLVENLLAQNHVVAARAALSRLREEAKRSGPGSLDAARLAAEARIAESEGDPQGALATARDAAQRYGDDPLARELFCRLLFYYGGEAETEENLAKLVDLDPENAAAHHNLGIARLRRSDFEGAVRAFEASLRTRPGAVMTQQSLAEAKRKLQSSL